MSANPIGLVIVAVGALVSALVYAYNHCEGFRKIVNRVWESIKPLAKAIMNGLVKAFEWLAEKCEKAWEWLKNILKLGGETVEVEVQVSKTEQAPEVDLGALEDKYAGFGDKGKTKPPKAPKPEEILPEGSIADYEKQISELNKKISLSVDPQSIALMTQQVKELELSIWDLKVRARIEGDREGFDRMVQDIEATPLSVDVKVKVDPKTLKPKSLDLGVSKWYQDILDSRAATKALWGEVSQVADAGRAAASAFSAMGDAMESPALNIAGIVAGAIANVMAGLAANMAKPAVTPWEWIAFSMTGLATAMGVISQIKQATAFANGGVVSGPTMALVGEYAGARNNPEVIAPLNKLRDLLPEPGAGSQHIVVSGRIKGADIVLSGSNYNKITSKSKHK